MRIIITLIACLIAIVYAGSLARDKRQSNQFLLPDGAELILTSAIDNSYVCSDEGIYADVNNNCEIFHICHITEEANGEASLRQYSFMCGNQTVFSQFSLTCATREEALPCQYAPEFFSLNKRIQQGKPDVLLHNEADIVRLDSLRGGSN